MSRNPSVDRFKQDMQDLGKQMAQNFYDTTSLRADELTQDMADAIEHSVSGDLKASLRKKDVSEKFGDIIRPSFLVIAGGQKTTRRTKSGAAYDYSIAEEMGTRNEAPRPFFFSTARRYTDKLSTGFQETLDQTIEANNKMRANRGDSNYTTGDFTRTSRGPGGAITLVKGNRPS